MVVYQRWKIVGSYFLYNLSNYSQFTGPVPLSTYMRIYKKGDIVDIKVSALGSL